MGARVLAFNRIESHHGAHRACTRAETGLFFLTADFRHSTHPLGTQSGLKRVRFPGVCVPGKVEYEREDYCTQHPGCAAHGHRPGYQAIPCPRIN